jgi:hypothetical protein
MTEAVFEPSLIVNSQLQFRNIGFSYMKHLQMLNRISGLKLEHE